MYCLVLIIIHVRYIVLATHLTVVKQEYTVLISTYFVIEMKNQHLKKKRHYNICKAAMNVIRFNNLLICTMKFFLP